MKRTIKDYRVGYGLTQQEVAKEIGCCPTQYCRKEKGVAPFTIDEYRKIYNLFSRFNKIDAGKFFLEA